MYSHMFNFMYSLDPCLFLHEASCARPVQWDGAEALWSLQAWKFRTGFREVPICSFGWDWVKRLQEESKLCKCEALRKNILCFSFTNPKCMRTWPGHPADGFLGARRHFSCWMPEVCREVAIQGDPHHHRGKLRRLRNEGYTGQYVVFHLKRKPSG